MISTTVLCEDDFISRWLIPFHLDFRSAFSLNFRFHHACHGEILRQWRRTRFCFKRTVSDRLGIEGVETVREAEEYPGRFPALSRAAAAFRISIPQMKSCRHFRKKKRRSRRNQDKLVDIVAAW